MLPLQTGLVIRLGEMAVDMRVLYSLLILILGYVLRRAAIRLIRGDSDIITDDARWWMVTIRNLLTVATAAALFVLWAPELGEFALSITAFAVALVIATRELILCVSGRIWAITIRPFDVGDWVEIGGHTGEIIDATMLGTTLQEIEPREYRYSGRTVTVPNSHLLTQPVINHNFRKRFLQHEFTLWTPAGADVSRIGTAIERALAAEAEEFSKLANRYAALIEKRTGVRLGQIAPSVRVETASDGTIGFRCMLFCPRDRAAEIEQAAAQAMFRALARSSEPVPSAAE